MRNLSTLETTSKFSSNKESGERKENTSSSGSYFKLGRSILVAKITNQLASIGGLQYYLFSQQGHKEAKNKFDQMSTIPYSTPCHY